MRRCTRDIKIQKQQKKVTNSPNGRAEMKVLSPLCVCHVQWDMTLYCLGVVLNSLFPPGRRSILHYLKDRFLFLSWLRAWFWLCSKHAHTSFANLNGYINMVLPARLRARWRCWSRRRAKSMAEQQVAAKSIKQIADFILKKKEKFEFERDFCWFDLLNYLEMLVGWRLDFAMVSSARWIRSSMPDWGVFI